MGDVLLARMRDGDTEDLVALKRMLPQYQEDPDLRTQFEREGRVCAMLAHPNVVGLKAFGADEHGPYLALEFVDGMSASELVKVARSLGGALPLPVALSIARDAVRGLNFAHQFHNDEFEIHGVLHRDVSLDNVLVGNDGHAKLADFGVARLIGATKLTRTGTFKGKHGYLAPEIFRGVEVSVASDTFAMAVTLYNLLCGVAPFHGKTDGELMYAVLSAEPPRTSSIRPDMPPEVDEWIGLGLSKEPAQRPSLQQLIDALDALIAPQEADTRTAVGAWVKKAVAIRPQKPSNPSLNRVSGPAPVVSRPATQMAQGLSSLKERRRRVVLMASVAALGLVLGVSVLTFLSRSQSTLAATVDAGLTTARTVDASVEARPPMVVAASLDAGPILPGKLWVKANIAAKVTIDGVPAGKTDLGPVELKPGPHTVLAEAAGQEKSNEIFVNAGDEKRIEFAFKVPAAVAKSPAGPVVTAKTGKLRIKVTPWAEVFVDGESHGTTPIKPLDLEPGSHQVLLVNGGKKKSRDVYITAGQEAEVKEAFE